MADRKIVIKRKKTYNARRGLLDGSNIEEWVAYWRANIHRFICDYLGLEFRDDFQPVLLYLMDRQPYFLYAASRGLAKKQHY